MLWKLATHSTQAKIVPAGRDGLRVTPTVAVVFGVVLAVGVFHCCAVS